MDIEQLAQTHGVTLDSNDRFEPEANDPETAEKKAQEETAERNFEEPQEETPKETPKETEESKPEGQPSEEPDVLTKWKGKTPEEIAKAHYHAEKWGKQQANENAALRKTLEALSAQVDEFKKTQQPQQPQQPLTQDQEDKLSVVKKKYGQEVVDMVAEIMGARNDPVMQELEADKLERESRRIDEFVQYHSAYQEANPDYAENIQQARTISTNMAGLMKEYMLAAKCSKSQIDSALNVMNFDKRLPGLVHIIVKGENVGKEAQRLAESMRQKEIEIANAKAELGGGGSVPNPEGLATPKFKSIDEETEWRRKNDPAYRSLFAFTQ